jgi:CheY-like chemotaxis protein
MNRVGLCDLRPLTILLVEDDDGDAQAVRRAFQKAKIANEILRAVDGIEALDILNGANGKSKPQAPFALLVDINMPRMNGIELIRAMRQDKELRPCTVFILTTSTCEEDMIAAYDLNVAGYIVKESAGRDFLSLVDLMEAAYARIVELPLTFRVGEACRRS